MDDMKNMFGKMRDFFLGEDEEYDGYNADPAFQASSQVQQPMKTQESVTRNQAPQNNPNVSYNRTQKATTKRNVARDQTTNYRNDTPKVAPRTQQQSRTSSTASAQASTPKQNSVEKEQLRKSTTRNMIEEEKLSTIIVIKEPNVYSDIMEVANIVKQNESVLVNFKHMDDKQARRSIDFCTGVVYTLEGDIQNVGGQIFLLTPSSVSVEASAELSLLARKNYEDFDL